MTILAKLGDMTPEERTAAFDAMTREQWPEATNMADTAAQGFRITRQAYFGWRREHRVPDWAFMLLDLWQQTYDAEREIREWMEAAKLLREIAETQAKLSDQIGRLGQHLADVADRHADALSRNAADAQAEQAESPKSSTE